MTEREYNTPIFNDPEPCDNLKCTNGYLYNDVWDLDYNVFITVKEKCPFCDDYGHKIK